MVCSLFQNTQHCYRGLQERSYQNQWRNVKPSREVYKNDQIIVRKDQINYQLEVLDIPLSRVGAKLVDLYRQDKTPSEAFEQAEIQKLAQEYYREKGEGRPTKKDRRAIDNLLNDFQESSDEDDLL